MAMRVGMAPSAGAGADVEFAVLEQNTQRRLDRKFGVSRPGSDIWRLVVLFLCVLALSLAVPSPNLSLVTKPRLATLSQ